MRQTPESRRAIVLRDLGPRPRAALIDLDDTVVSDSARAEENWRLATDAATAPFGVAAAPLLAAIHEERNWFWSDPDRHREGRADLGATRLRIVAAAVARAGVRPDIREDVARAVAAAYSEQTERDRAPIPGSIEALRELRDFGLRLALVTNGAAAPQREKIARFGLESFFETIVIEGELGVGKPDEAVYRQALDGLGCAPEDAWMVGDNLEWDVLAPQRLGARGIWLVAGTIPAAGLDLEGAARIGAGTDGPHAVVADLAAFAGLVRDCDSSRGLRRPRGARRGNLTAAPTAAVGGPARRHSPSAPSSQRRTASHSFG